MQTLATGHLTHEGRSPHNLSGGRVQESSGVPEAKGGHGAPRTALPTGPHHPVCGGGCIAGRDSPDPGFQPHPGSPLSVPSGPLSPRAGRHPNPLGCLCSEYGRHAPAGPSSSCTRHSRGFRVSIVGRDSHSQGEGPRSTC
ncbi:hypothetical protein H8958_018036, partial [Nasalis larvatus]